MEQQCVIGDDSAVFLASGLQMLGVTGKVLMALWEAGSVLLSTALIKGIVQPQSKKYTSTPGREASKLS